MPLLEEGVSRAPPRDVSESGSTALVNSNARNIDALSDLIMVPSLTLRKILNSSPQGTDSFLEGSSNIMKDIRVLSWMASLSRENVDSRFN